MGLTQIREATNLWKVLDVYLAALSQLINEDTSSILFFNTPGAIQRRIALILRFQVGTFPLTYLGIPISPSNPPRESWQGILDKFRSKVEHWTHIWLSFTGRVQLIQSVVQALPIYHCMLQVAPMWFLKGLDSLASQFLWTCNLSSSKWILVNWDLVCSPKQLGGLGLRQVILFEEALAAKLYQRWCVEQDHGWAKLLAYKYMQRIPIQEVPRYPFEGKGSMIWYTLKKGASLIKEGLFWIYGRGEEVLFWNDSWDGYPPILVQFLNLGNLS